jgi:hypothetical protein
MTSPPKPPSPKVRRGLNSLFIKYIAPLPWERGWGEVKEGRERVPIAIGRGEVER